MSKYELIVFAFSPVCTAALLFLCIKNMRAYRKRKKLQKELNDFFKQTSKDL